MLRRPASSARSSGLPPSSASNACISFWKKRKPQCRSTGTLTTALVRVPSAAMCVAFSAAPYVPVPRQPWSATSSERSVGGPKCHCSSSVVFSMWRVTLYRRPLITWTSFFEITSLGWTAPSDLASASMTTLPLSCTCSRAASASCAGAAPSAAGSAGSISSCETSTSAASAAAGSCTSAGAASSMAGAGGGGARCHGRLSSRFWCISCDTNAANTSCSATNASGSVQIASRRHARRPRDGGGAARRWIFMTRSGMSTPARVETRRRASPVSSSAIAARVFAVTGSRNFEAYTRR